MDFDPLFEDLEARFIASKTPSDLAFSLDVFRLATTLQVLTIGSQRLTLFAPVLGQDFAAGLQPEAPIWHILPMQAIKSLAFKVEENSKLPSLQIEEFSLMQYLERLPLPAKCNLRLIGADSPVIESTLAGVGQGLLFLQRSHRDSVEAIPLGGFAQLSISPVYNSHTNF